MRRQLSLAVVAAVATATVSVPISSASAAAVQPARHAAHHPARHSATKWYLALGDSLAAGYQPTTGDDKTGGYVGGALAMLKLRNRGIELTNLACSGEDTTTFTTGTKCGGGVTKSQQAEALKFLHAHRHTKGIVTIDLGANDIDGCVAGGTIDMTCLQTGLQNVETKLPPILQQLHAAAPNAKIVVLNYYNPFLATWLTGTQGQAVAKQSEALATTFNGEIAQAAATIDAPVADIAKAFQSDADTPLVNTSYGEVPTNVAVVCGLTWMCSRQNIHANDLGYAVMSWALAPYLLGRP